MKCPTCGNEIEHVYFPPRMHFRTRGQRQGAEIVEETILPVGNASAESTFFHRRAKGVQRVPLVIVTEAR